MKNSTKESNLSTGQNAAKFMNSLVPDEISGAGILLADRVQYYYEKSICDKGVVLMSESRNFGFIHLKVENVQLQSRFGSSTEGIIYLTTTDLIFAAKDRTLPSNETWVLASHIGSVERGSLSASGCTLNVRTKTFRLLTFIIPRDKDCQDVFETLARLSSPARIEDLHAFNFAPADRSLQREFGWDLIDVDKDYERLLGDNNPYWVASDFNQGFTRCDTYPENLYVPKSASKQILIGSCKFRSRGRLPTLSYYSSSNHASICRCSQPMAGFSARCVEDEEMINCILQTNPNCNVLYICDSRPLMNAMANKAQGKGWEDEKFYTNIKFHFQNIDNIHTMRNSLAKLTDACFNAKYNAIEYLNAVEKSLWLTHIRAVLEASQFLASSVSQGISCVVHCSDGWDRTPQTISTASILLDPHYRTIRGFMTLIQKDWLSFGHKFSDRCGHTGQATGGISALSEGMGEGNKREVSPIFTQFLECVWHISVQYPRAFEFNELFLLELHDHVHSCQYGTFIGNCVKDRVDLKLKNRTYSLWGFLWKRMEIYLNPFYSSEANNNRLVLDLRPQAMRVWRGIYNRYDQGLHPRENLNEAAAVAKDHCSVLEDHLQLLQKRATELRHLLGKVPKSPTTSSFMVDSGHSSTFGHSVDAENSIAKRQSDSESGVEDNSSGGNQTTSGPHPKIGQVSTGLSQSLASLDLSITDVCSSQFSTLAVKWQSLRHNSCNACERTHLPYQNKGPCYKCGAIFCRDCLRQDLALSGLLSERKVPVCKVCYKEVTAVTPE